MTRHIVFAIALLASPAAAAPPAATGPAWAITLEKGQPAQLIYGDGQLALRCPPASGGQVSVALRVTSARTEETFPASVGLSSGVESATLRGVAGAARDSVRLAETEISTAAPVIAAFRKTGQITANALGQTLIPADAKPGMVRRFIGACR